MKKGGWVLFTLACFGSLAFSAPLPQEPGSAGATVGKGDIYVSPIYLGGTAYDVSVSTAGVNVEFFLTNSIGLGLDATFVFQSPNGVILAPEISFHLPVKVESLDFFLGAGPGFAIPFSEDYDTLIGGVAFGGARYFFSPKSAVYTKLGAMFDEEGTEFLYCFGISFKL